MNNEPLIRLDSVSAGYGRKVVLSQLDLAIPRGAFIALLGANGSGKSTLLKTLAGIIPPVDGSIQFQGRSGGRLALGYVPQRESLDPLFLLSGLEVAHMGMFRRIRPGRIMPPDEQKHVWECLRLAGAEEFALQQFSELSGGQKQRILIARALATSPELLLLDEPTAGIDGPSAQAVMEVLERLHREQGIGILLVTHDLHAVRRHVRQVIWLHEGRLLQGSVEELLSPAKLSELFELSLG